MSFPTFHTKKSILKEECLWIRDGNRYICITYEYIPNNGAITYAASVLRLSAQSGTPKSQQISDHEHTTTRRFKIRPVFTYLGAYLDKEEMVKCIRREMCHGAGCVGARYPIIRTDDQESLSSVEMLSDTSESDEISVSPKTYDVKNMKCIKYHMMVKEPHGQSPYTHRTIFICFKGLSKTGEMMYGACIHRAPAWSMDESKDPEIDEDGHYETAMMRLEKCPVKMIIPEEFRHQLKKKTKHSEDIMYLILDKITKRVGGNMVIKGTKLPVTNIENVPVGWSKPHEYMYLKGHCKDQFNQPIRCDTFDEAIDIANAYGDECGGITKTNLKGIGIKYEIRKGSEFRKTFCSKKPNHIHDGLVSWIKN